MEKFDSISLIKSICKEKKIAISTLEKECEFSNGYIRGLKEKSMPADRMLLVANYLDVSIEYLITGKKPEIPDAFISEYHSLIEVFRKFEKEQQISILNMLYSIAPKN